MARGEIDTPNLRPIRDPADGALPEITASAQAALLRALARSPVALAVVYECKEGLIRWEGAPHSSALIRGLVADLHDGFSGVPNPE
jgi:hypothetical protein